MLLKLSGMLRRFCVARLSNFHQNAISADGMKSSNRYKVHVIPALKDNYMYLLADKQLKIGIAIDPVEPESILKVANEVEVELKAVLTTHHHFDHAGGNKLISELVKNVPIYGFDERIESLTNTIHHNEIIDIGDFKIRCLHTPCHTSGHICYFFPNIYPSPICFTGDTLFVSGCGRFFEGSASDMLNSLNILKALPLNTELYCGHEYTISNLKFSLHVEPDNKQTLKKLREVEEKLKRKEPSVPSTIGEELTYNPFLRYDCESIKNQTKEVAPVNVMAVLREIKNNM